MSATMAQRADRIAKRRLREATMRRGGGVYVYRTRKPMSLLGLLPIPWWAPLSAATAVGGAVAAFHGPWWIATPLLFTSGRHFGYVGETVSFVDRHAEHTLGGGRWDRAAQPWSDLDPRCVVRIPLPGWKPLLRGLESILIFSLAPVYNERGNLWNLRRIPRSTARRQRWARARRKTLPISWNLRGAHLLVIVTTAIVIHLGGL